MNCPTCKEPMEKARKSNVWLCRDCGHRDVGVSKDQVIERLAKVETELAALKSAGEKKPTAGDDTSHEDEW